MDPNLNKAWPVYVYLSFFIVQFRHYYNAFEGEIFAHWIVQELI